jgi:hypothetical protein
MKLPILLPALLLLSSTSFAQESPGETQSIRCAALAHIHTVISTPPEFNESMANMTMLFTNTYTSFREIRTGSTTTNGVIGRRQDTVEAELRDTWKSKPVVVVEEMALCNTWRANFAERIPAYMASLGSKEPSAKGLVQLVGKPPIAPRPGEVEKWQPATKMAFDAWAETGSQTGGEARDALRKQLQDAIKKQQ